LENSPQYLFLASGVNNGEGFWIVGIKNCDENILDDENLLDCHRKELLGNEFGINNKIIFVDSSSGEVERPSTKKTGLIGISDIYDNLKFDMVFKNGPKEYISWFIELANKRSNFKKNS